MEAFDTCLRFDPRGGCCDGGGSDGGSSNTLVIGPLGLLKLALVKDGALDVGSSASSGIDPVLFVTRAVMTKEAKLDFAAGSV